MNQLAIDRATEAVFHMQLQTKDAMRYVIKTAGVDAKTAGQALKQVMVGYKL
jgi:translation initiation factor 2 alpha subunit (eIF-2alpha)